MLLSICSFLFFLDLHCPTFLSLSGHVHDVCLAATIAALSISPRLCDCPARSTFASFQYFSVFLVCLTSILTKATWPCLQASRTGAGSFLKKHPPRGCPKSFFFLKKNSSSGTTHRRTTPGSVPKTSGITAQCKPHDHQGSPCKTDWENHAKLH